MKKNKSSILNLLFTFCLGFITSLSVGQISKTISLGTAIDLGNLNSVNGYVQLSFSQDTGRLNWSMSPGFLITAIKKTSRLEIYERESYLTASLSRRYGAWKLIGFTDAENSFLRKTLFRFSGGVGVGCYLLERGGWKLSLSKVFMPEIYLSEDFTNDRFLSLRLSTRFKIKYNGKLNFESVTFFQPSLWTSGNLKFRDNINFRMANNIDFPIFDKISLGLQNTIQVFTLPSYLDRGVGNFDTQILILFKTQF